MEKFEPRCPLFAHHTYIFSVYVYSWKEERKFTLLYELLDDLIYREQKYNIKCYRTHMLCLSLSN